MLTVHVQRNVSEKKRTKKEKKKWCVKGFLQEKSEIRRKYAWKGGGKMDMKCFG